MLRQRNDNSFVDFFIDFFTSSSVCLFTPSSGHSAPAYQYIRKTPTYRKSDEKSALQYTSTSLKLQLTYLPQEWWEQVPSSTTWTLLTQDKLIDRLRQVAPGPDGTSGQCKPPEVKGVKFLPQYWHAHVKLALRVEGRRAQVCASFVFFFCFCFLNRYRP